MVQSLPDRFSRIVVKVGTSTITHAGGKLHFDQIDKLVRQLVDVKNAGRDVLLVTSGAIGAGMGELSLQQRPRLLSRQQAAAALGQGQLIGVYNKFLREYGERGGQVLLTGSDMEDRSRYLNAFDTLLALLQYGVIPVINENDTVATDEIKFGDNDTLAALVAGLVEADLLINLTDTEGLYRGGPPDDETEEAEIIRSVAEITPEIERLAGSKGTPAATGGMETKIEAAKVATGSGITMVIAPGHKESVVLETIDMLEQGTDLYLGTTFLPQNDTLSKRKQWLLYNMTPEGSVTVDPGARDALVENGKSLLPSGITSVTGDFARGELIKILDRTEEPIARGLANYSASEVNRIKGKHSEDIYDILGYIYQEEVLHRDNMVVTD